MATTLCNLVILAWLIAAAWQDARTRQVSNGLTVPPLLAAVAWSAARGDCVPAVLLAAILGCQALCALWARAAAKPLLSVLAVMSLAAALALFTGRLLTPAVWAIAYAAWQLNLIGGADAKLTMALIAGFPDLRLAMWVLLACFLVSVAMLAARGRVGAAMIETVRRLWRLDLPTPVELEATGAPLVSAFALAFGAWWATGGGV